jgi:hypothetical protein
MKHDYDMKGLFMWTGATLLNIFGTIERTDVTFVLGVLSTGVVIVYHMIKIRKELRNK